MSGKIKDYTFMYFHFGACPRILKKKTKTKTYIWSEKHLRYTMENSIKGILLKLMQDWFKQGKLEELQKIMVWLEIKLILNSYSLLLFTINC